MKLTDKIPALPKLLMRIVGYCIAAAIVYALIHGFAMFRIAHHTEECSAATGRSTQSIANQAGQIDGGLYRTTQQFPRNLFSTLRCKCSPACRMPVQIRRYLDIHPAGQRIQDQHGRQWYVYRRVCHRQRGLRNRYPAPGASGATIWSGFYDRGTVWPPDAKPDSQ